METYLKEILSQMWRQFIHLWPFLLISIPMAAAIDVIGISKYINRVVGHRPITAIVLATVIGAFSPFCSCTSVAVMASLLIGGVPLAPVMSLWVASPSMDPEMFFLTVGMIGWKLAVWRLVATLGMSLAAGLITHFLINRNWIQGDRVLKMGVSAPAKGHTSQKFTGFRLQNIFRRASPSAGSSGDARPVTPDPDSLSNHISGEVGSSCSNCPAITCCLSEPQLLPVDGVIAKSPKMPSMAKRILRSSIDASLLVGKFMAIALFLEAIITLYIPTGWVVGILGKQSAFAVPLATLIGLPMYTSNLTALPMIAGLLDRGMAAPAALAFLMAGPTTTLPAMACVWGIVKRRIFILYILIVLVSSIASGYIFMLFR